MSVGRLVQALGGPDADSRLWVAGEVTEVRADGTVLVDLGRGPVVAAVVGDAPTAGDVVAVLRQQAGDGGRLLVLGALRTDNPATVGVQTQLALAWDVRASAAGPGGGPTGSTEFTATATRSWRSGTGWSRSNPYQGVYTSQYGVWRGAYFYGSAPQSLRGLVITRARIRLSRVDAGGSNAPVPIYLALHDHGGVPGGRPRERSARVQVAALARPGSGTSAATVDLPTSWGQSIADGRTRGVLHVDNTSGAYAIMSAVSGAEYGSSDALSGRLTLDWRLPT